MALTLSKKAAGVKPSSTLAITAKAKQLRAEGIDIVGFGAGEPDFNTPDNINRVAIHAIESGFTKYTPASGIMELKEAVSKKFAQFNGLTYNTDQIVISNGGKHSLTNVFQALLNPGDEVIIPAPYWLSYPEIVKLCSGVPIIIFGEKENGYKITAAQIEKAVTVNTKAVIINSPNNPTGMVYTEEELRKIADVAVKRDIYVISDEMYENLIYKDKKHISIASLSKDIYDRTITCSGVSKSYAMTGWRIGYTGSSSEIASLMANIQSHETSNPNTIAQRAAWEALTGPQDTVREMHKEFDRRREYMSARVSEMPLVDMLEPEGAFYLFIDFTDVLEKSYKGVRIGTTKRAAEILLEDYHVAVIPCPDFGFLEFIRLSYAISISSIEKGLDRIEKFLTSL